MRARSRVCSAIATSILGVALAAPLAGLAQAQDGAAAWRTIARVLASPRCLNCHPRGDTPTQADDMHRHRPAVQRGRDDAGIAAMRCAACHANRNQEIAGVPGAPHWQLAPASMGWTGLASGALCRTIKDMSRNGNRSVPALVTHMTEDALVRWAWTPGASRTPPPVPLGEFVSALNAWATAGAPCPD
jgi:hypothetical protein